MAESRAAYMREYRKKKKEVTQKERAETVATKGPAEEQREKVTQGEHATAEFLAALGLGIAAYLRQRSLYEEAADLAEAARELLRK